MINTIKKKLHLEDTSSILIGLWITLPFIMVLCHTVQGIRGKFPTREEIEAAGLTFQYITLYYNRQTYQLLFHILGVISILYVIYMCFSKEKGKLFKDEMFKNKRFLYYLFGLLIWSCVCAAFSDNLAYAFVGEDYLCDGLSSYFIYAAVFAIAYSITSDKDKLNLIRYFVFMVTVLSILMLIQTLHVIDFLDYIFTTRAAIIFLQFNHYGYILCMAVCASFGLFLFDENASKKINIFYIVTFIINYVALVINDTFGAWLAVVIALPIIYIVSYKAGRRKLSIKAVIIVFVLMLGLSFLTSSSLKTSVSTFVNDVGNVTTEVTSDSSEAEAAAASAGSSRWTLWKDTIERIKERPIFGFGPEGFYGDNAITNGDSTHNEYLQIAGFLGIPGLILYLIAIIMLLVHQFKNLKTLSSPIFIATCTMGGYLISACFGNPVFNTFPYYMMFFGLAASYEIKKQKKK